ncbi:MAG: hypothetical protein V3T70_09955 [Phycisphaerae bacterium]
MKSGSTPAAASRFRPLVFVRWAITASTVAASAACGPRATEIRLESLRDPANPVVYAESFDTAYFRVNERDRWDIVLFNRRASEQDPNQTIEQFLHLRLFWRPIPGTTYAESSQTDAVIRYCLATGPAAATYDGAGFVYLSVGRNRATLSGRIESANLAPSRQAGGARDLFGTCRLTGEFVARQDAGRTTALLTQLAGRMGVKSDSPLQVTSQTP